MAWAGGATQSRAPRMTVAVESVSAALPASGSSFYTAMRILPRAQRDAMFEIYSFCRHVDDIADSDAPRSERLAELDAWRAEFNELYDGRIGTKCLTTGSNTKRRSFKHSLSS